MLTFARLSDPYQDWKVIARLLAACVADQYLYVWYDWNKIQHIAQVIASNGALAEIAEAWEMPPFLAQDLVKLALFDVMFLLDDSASMRSEGTYRRDSLKQIVKRAADASCRLDPDGLEVAWMNTDLPPQLGTLHSAQDAVRLVENCRFDGRATPLGDSFERKLLRPHLYDPISRGYLKKPILALIIGDGRPTGSTEKGERIVQVILQARDRLKNSQWGEDALSVTIAAVGNDREAQEWLDSIDSHPVVGDLVDVVSDIRIEAAQVKRSTGLELTPDLHCLKMLLGSIDSTYDASDEGSMQSSKYSRKRREKEEKDRRFAGLKARLVADRDAALNGSQGHGQQQQGPAYGNAPYPPQQQQNPYQAYGVPPSGPYGAPPAYRGDTGSHSRNASAGSGGYPQPGPGGYGPPGGSHNRNSSAGSNSAYDPSVGGFSMPPGGGGGGAPGYGPTGYGPAGYGQSGYPGGGGQGEKGQGGFPMPFPGGR